MALSKKTLLQDGDINKDQEELVFDPYNPNNHEITTTQVSEILKKYGVPDKVHKLVSNRLKISMNNQVRSLNIASSVAIVLAESLRQIELI